MATEVVVVVVGEEEERGRGPTVERHACLSRVAPTGLPDTSGV